MLRSLIIPCCALPLSLSTLSFCCFLFLFFFSLYPAAAAVLPTNRSLPVYFLPASFVVLSDSFCCRVVPVLCFECRLPPAVCRLSLSRFFLFSVSLFRCFSLRPRLTPVYVFQSLAFIRSSAFIRSFFVLARCESYYHSYCHAQSTLSQNTFRTHTLMPRVVGFAALITPSLSSLAFFHHQIISSDSVSHRAFITFHFHRLRCLLLFCAKILVLASELTGGLSRVWRYFVFL